MLMAQISHRHTAFTLSQDRKIARIWGSLYLVIFIRNLLMHLAEKILLPQPLTFGGITAPRPNAEWISDPSLHWPLKMLAAGPNYEDSFSDRSAENRQ